MTVKISTGLQNKSLDTGSFKTILTGGLLILFGGAEPATADEAQSATVLCTVSVNSGGGGLNFAANAVNGTLSKAAEVWSGVNSAGGAATHFRFVAAADDGTASITQARIQGSVGVAGADLNITDVNLANAAPQSIDYFSIALPAS